MKKITLFLFVTVLAVIIASCDNTTRPDPFPAPSNLIILNNSSDNSIYFTINFGMPPENDARFFIRHEATRIYHEIIDSVLDFLPGYNTTPNILIDLLALEIPSFNFADPITGYSATAGYRFGVLFVYPCGGESAITWTPVTVNITWISAEGFHRVRQP